MKERSRMRLAKAFYFWTMATSVTLALYFVVLAVQASVVLGGRPRDGRPMHRIASLWGRTLIKFMPGWRVHIEGREHLPPDHQPMVIVANHESMSDIWGMYYLGIQFRWLSKDSIFRLPMVGHAMRWSNYVPIVRGRRDSAAHAMEQSALRLRQGLSMFFFPEGTRSLDGVIKPFKIGAFKLAMEEQKPVLPIAIHGAADLLPKGSWAPGSACIQIRILPPVPPPRADENLDAYAEAIRARIVAVHSQLI